MVSPPGLDPDDLAAPGHAEALLGRLVALHLRHGRQSPAGGGAGGASSGAAPSPEAGATGSGGTGSGAPAPSSVGPAAWLFGFCVEVMTSPIDFPSRRGLRSRGAVRA